MSTILGLLSESPKVEQPRVTPIRERVRYKRTFPALSIHDEQIRGLVHALFFMQETRLVRHVGFVSTDGSTETARLCLNVARALTGEDSYDIGIIDARINSASLEVALKIKCPTNSEGPRLIESRLWIVPRESWLPEGSEGQVTNQNLSRLSELTRDYDFSILSCDPFSWRTMCIGKACDGVVLVLHANKTRRIVARQARDQLRDAQVPLLGTVLAERRFPVPPSLYRSL